MDLFDVTIGIPSYGREKLLIKKIKNLKAQTYTNIKFHLSCNKKISIKTKKKVRNLLKNKKLFISIQKKNIGAWNNFLFLLRAAKTKYFMWASDDDYHSPEFVSQLKKILDKNPDSVLSMCGFKTIDKFGNEYRRTKQIWSYFTHQGINEKDLILDPELFGKANYIHGLWRTEALKKIVLKFKQHACMDQCIVLDAILNYKVCFLKKVMFLKQDLKRIGRHEKISFSKPEAGYFFNLTHDSIYKKNLFLAIKTKNKILRTCYFYIRQFIDLKHFYFKKYT